MKQLYELLTYPLSIIEDPFWNFVLMTIIGSLSFVVAWNFVGETGIRGKAGSILHWTVRIIVMFLLCFITSLVIKLVIFIYNIPLVTWLAIGIIVMLILLIFIVLKFTLFGKKEKKMNQIDKQKNRYIVLMKRIINYYFQYEEIENMLIKENLLVKDEKNNSNMEFRTIIFLEKYVKDSMSYMVNVLVFIITFITLFISVFQQLIGVYVNFLLLPSIILITILIFKVLPRDKK